MVIWIICKIFSKGGDEDVVYNGVKNLRKYEFGCYLNMKLF